MKLKTVLSVVISLGLVLFSVTSFPYLLARANEDIFLKEFEKRKTERFSGVITLWQVDSFEGGVGSRTAWLNARLAELEKRYNGVYFSVKSVSVEMLDELLSHSAPDLISFGHGVFNLQKAQDCFEPLECPQGLVPSLAQSGQGYAVPLFFGAYCILTDTAYAKKYMLEQGLDGYLSSNFGTVTHNKKRISVIPLAARGDNTALVSLALANTRLKASPELYNADVLWDNYNYNRICASIVCSQRQLYRLEAAQKQNKSRPSTLAPLSGYTDMVQYIAAFKGAPDSKKKIIAGAISHLTDQSVQMKVSSIGLLPASLGALESIKYENPYMQQLCHHIKNTKIATPSAFYTPPELNNMALDLLMGRADNAQAISSLLYR